jgi:hypothetical protein
VIPGPGLRPAKITVVVTRSVHPVVEPAATVGMTAVITLPGTIAIEVPVASSV